MVPGCGMVYNAPTATRRGMCLPRWKRDHFLKLYACSPADQETMYFAEWGNFRRNSTSVSDYVHPIHYLPVEILQKIFSSVAEPRLPDHDPFLQVYPEWIAITYVCRHWRAVALNHHSLWATITPNLSLTWLKVLMARSEPAQVDVELRVGQLYVKRMRLSVDDAIALLSDCTRIRSLRLLGPRRDVCAVLDALRMTTPIHSLALSLWEL